jgi:hypothetical protein
MITHYENINQSVSHVLARCEVTCGITGGEKTVRDDGAGTGPWDCYHWTATFSKPPRHGGTTQRFDFYTGSGLVTKKCGIVEPIRPTAADILFSLLLDASAAHENFSDWCANYGYSDDSLKALRLYQESIKTAQRLRTLFSAEQLAEIKDMVEEL